MRRHIFLAAFFVLLPLCEGQSKLEFEVATIKPAPLQPIGRTSVRRSSNTTTGDLAYSNVNLRDLMVRAFGVQDYQISGPEWMTGIRWDIAAKFTPGSTQEQLRQMLQALLADRFHLKFHRETKELPAYALVAAKGGPKMKPSDQSGDSSSNSNGKRVHLETKATMTQFAEYLSGGTDRPVLDQTGLTGAYEIALDYTASDLPEANNDGTVASLFTALPEQLGLKLEAAKGQVEFFVVDSVDKTPTEN